MTENIMKSVPVDYGRASKKALDWSAKIWFVIMLFGQWMFVYYVADYYGGLLIPEGVTGLKNSHLPNGYLEGDTLGNIAISAHLLIAVIIIGGGPLQMVPAIRNNFPAFHRWNGRIYVFASVLTSAAGLYLTWARETVIGDLSQHIGITIDGLLIFLFSYLAVKSARARDFTAHRRWALRLFMVVSAVWFIRLGLMGWIVANGAPVGFDPNTLVGPTMTILNYAQYIVPLAILELYFMAQRSKNPAGRFAMAGGLFLATVVMAFGIFSATVGMWLPRI